MESDSDMKKVCRDFMRGTCTRDNCRFIHDKKLCKNWYRNYQNNRKASCKYGLHCRNNHFVDTTKTTTNPANLNRKNPKNTESWEPPTSPYDMRVLFDTNKDKLTYDLTSRDVLVANNIFSNFETFDLHDKLEREIKTCNIQNNKLLKMWHGNDKIEGTHLICDDHIDWKKDCPTFTFVINKLIDYFGVIPSATRLNWYTNHEQFKPFHRDSSALYPEKQKKQNITIACSFGQTRDIVFQHIDNKKTVAIPQGDGQVYTFGNQVNMTWRHGVSQGKIELQESRISIIIWGFVEGVTV